MSTNFLFILLLTDLFLSVERGTPLPVVYRITLRGDTTKLIN